MLNVQAYAKEHTYSYRDDEHNITPTQMLPLVCVFDKINIQFISE